MKNETKQRTREVKVRLTEGELARLNDNVALTGLSREQYLRLLSGLRNASAELIPTLTAYLLDAGSSMTETARLLYVHLNTVKYRLRQVQKLTGFSPTQLPGAYSLYITAAINRLSREEN